MDIEILLNFNYEHLKNYLLNSSVDAGVVGGNISQQREETFVWTGVGGNTSGAKLAGVTEDFAESVSDKIEEYCKTVEDILKDLESTDSKIAFKGEAIGRALENFVSGVKESAFSYLNKLKAAEQQIVYSVNKTYQAQDTDISGNLSADASKL